jgi:hypothetical protein
MSNIRLQAIREVDQRVGTILVEENGEIFPGATRPRTLAKLCRVPGRNELDLAQRMADSFNACSPCENPLDALAEARRALEFYADPLSWKVIDTGIGECPSTAECDGGERARAALAKLGKAAS